jgi:hypothetical protein
VKKAQKSPGRGKGKPFEPGKAPKSPGRPSKPAECKAFAEKHSLANMKAYQALVDNPNTPANVRATGYKDLLAYANVIARAELSGKDGAPLIPDKYEGMTIEEVREFVALAKNPT